MSHLHFEMDFNWSCGAVKVKNRLYSLVIFWGKLFSCTSENQFKYHVLGLLLQLIEEPFCDEALALEQPSFPSCQRQSNN